MKARRVNCVHFVDHANETHLVLEVEHVLFVFGQLSLSVDESLFLAWTSSDGVVHDQRVQNPLVSAVG